jgi:adenylate cyclase
MKEEEIVTLSTWVTEVGLKGKLETSLLQGFAERVVRYGVPLKRIVLLMDTLHPIHEGRAFRWDLAKPDAEMVEYGSTADGEAAERWRASPFYRMLERGEQSFHSRIDADSIAEYSTLADLKDEGITDYLAMIRRFAADGVIGEMDCFYASWMTDDPNGFSDDDVAALERLTPFVGLAIKAASLGRIAETLVETYLGRDAGRRVLSGRINRGVADRSGHVRRQGFASEREAFG